jgi:response regulator of citrate/malate metabolism
MKKRLNCVLLIDDDIASNFLSEKIIRNADITNEIKIAPNGEVAIANIEEEYFDNNSSPELILLDINMPIMDGIDFFSRYKSIFDRNTGSTIIAFTSSIHYHQIDTLFQLGISDYISKPLTSDKITRVMETHFGW